MPFAVNTAEFIVNIASCDLFRRGHVISLGRVNVRDLFGRCRCRRSVRLMPYQRFSNVSALVYLLYRVKEELKFENVCLAMDEMQHFQHLCHLMKHLCLLMQHLCLVTHQMQEEEEEEEALCCQRSSLGRARLASPPHALQEHPDGHENAPHEHARQPAFMSHTLCQQKSWL